MSTSKHSRTERATPQKRKKAREKGQVFRSKEVSAALGFVSAILAIWWMGGRVKSALTSTMVYFFAHCAEVTSQPQELAAEALLRASVVGIPFMLLTMVFSVGGAVAQSLPVFTFVPFTPDVKRLFSIGKLASMFKPSGGANLARGVLGLGALGLSGISVLGPELETVASLPAMSVTAIAGWVSTLVGRLFARAAIIFILIGVIDYVLNHRQHETELKMTKQEVKEEHKQLEGDPQIKGRIRRIQRAAAKRRMMANVEQATVVITNPTHVAVALLYDSDVSPAPRVVAKGKGELALRIRERARSHDVVIYEDPPLARALYAVELGATIPAELYKAVAEVLAHLVRLSSVRG